MMNHRISSLVLLLLVSLGVRAEGWQLVDMAQESTYQKQQPIAQGKYIADLKLHTEAEISALLQKAEDYYQQHGDAVDTPIQLVLHGSEVHFFRKKNYEQYKSIVDKAAKLDAFNVVDVKICETWMRYNDTNKAELPAFVDTVPLGPEEEKRLMRQGYSYF